ncbi:DUF6879 family protein [Streptomyces sp. ISL-11]|uniref:DUF6879 family protein n=1 Tax=Streptomyces sp. ISL-11 TaxID=2819174 RepID=UPI001BED28A5|nr:DUF6879 family protein [Streptomyces sp. ISL-11]MBT2384255.1 hypothetical protein [Streptomyces sp. ISL-11]
MPQNTAPSFSDLIAQCRHSAVHLEMRDCYGVGEEAAEFEAWCGGWRPDPDPATWWNPSHTTVRDAVARGVVFRRARIVSEPVSTYITYEYTCTYQNITAGEQVRWLPRRKASDLALPGNDLWLFDDRLVRFGHFTGQGASAGHELCDDPAVVKMCASAFESVWERATPHEEFSV